MLKPVIVIASVALAAIVAVAIWANSGPKPPREPAGFWEVDRPFVLSDGTKAMRIFTHVNSDRLDVMCANGRVLFISFTNDRLRPDLSGTNLDLMSEFDGTSTEISAVFEESGVMLLPNSLLAVMASASRWKLKIGGEYVASFDMSRFNQAFDQIRIRCGFN